MKSKEKKLVLVTVAITLLVMVFLMLAYTVMWNKDSTCYNYAAVAGVCSSDFTQCWPWAKWERTCDWIQKVVYQETSSFRCWRANPRPATTYRVCQVKEYDYTSPESQGWVE